IPELEFQRRICLTSSTASRGPARVRVRGPASDSPSRRASSKHIVAASGSKVRKARAARSLSLCRWQGWRLKVPPRRNQRKNEDKHTAWPHDNPTTPRRCRSPWWWMTIPIRAKHLEIISRLDHELRYIYLSPNLAGIFGSATAVFLGKRPVEVAIPDYDWSG